MTEDICNILNIISNRPNELDKLESTLKKKYHSNLIAGRSKQEVIDDAKSNIISALFTVTNDIQVLNSNLNHYINIQEDLSIELESKVDIITNRINAIKQQKTNESLNLWRNNNNSNNNNNVKENFSYIDNVDDIDKYNNNYIIERLNIFERLQKLDDSNNNNNVIANNNDDDNSISTRNKITFKVIERKPVVDNKIYI